MPVVIHPASPSNASPVVVSPLKQLMQEPNGAIPTTINWEALSETGAWTMTHIAFPISCGLSPLEVSAQVGETTGWVHKKLAKLRGELERLNT